jgi:hypothetical protein
MLAIEGVSPEFVLDLVPEGGVPQAGFNQVVVIASVAMHPSGPGYILVDALGNGIGLLKYHPYPQPHFHRIDARGVDVLRMEKHLARGHGAGNKFIYPVESPE